MQGTFSDFLTRLRTQGVKAMAGKLSSHLPGAAVSWNALLHCLSSDGEYLPAALQFIQDLSAELQSAPAVAPCLLGAEVVTVVMWTVVDAMRSAIAALDYRADVQNVEAVAYVFQYCAKKNREEVLSADVSAGVEALLVACIRGVEKLENADVMAAAPALLSAVYSYCQLLEKNSAAGTLLRLTTQLHLVDCQVQKTPQIASGLMKCLDCWRLLGAPEGLSCRLLLLHVLSFSANLSDHTSSSLLQILKESDSDTQQVNCVLLYLRLRYNTQTLISAVGAASPLCQCFWKFYREVQREAEGVKAPRWLAAADFQQFWSALLRLRPTDTFLLAPLLDFLDHDSLQHLRADAMQFVLKTLLTSEETRFKAAEMMVIKRRLITEDFIEAMLQHATYPEELQYILWCLQQDPSRVSLAQLLVRVCRSPPAGTRDLLTYRFSRQGERDVWNLAAKLHVPSLHDAIFSLGGADIFLYAFDLLPRSKDPQSLRVCLLTLASFAISSASPHFGALLGLKVEEMQIPLAEEEITEILDMAKRNNAQKQPLLLSTRLWSQITDQQYNDRLYPEVINMLGNSAKTEQYLQFYDELWKRRAHSELRKKAVGVLQTLQNRGNPDLSEQLLCHILRNKYDPEKERPVTDSLCQVISAHEDTSQVLRMLPDFIQRLKGGASRIFCCGVQLLDAALRKQVETRYRYLDLLKSALGEVTWEVYQTLLHFFAGEPGDAELSSDVLKQPGLSALMELLSYCTGTDAKRVWIDFESVLQQKPALVTEVSPSLLVDVVVNFLRKGPSTTAYFSVAKLLTFRTPLTDNIILLRAFTVHFLSLERREAWSLFADIVEQMAVLVKATEGAREFFSNLLQIVYELAQQHNTVLELGFTAVLKTVENYLREPEFYVKNVEFTVSPKRALLVLLTQALKETNEELETRLFLKAVDCVLETVRPSLLEGDAFESEGFIELWTWNELLATVEQSVGAKLQALCSYLVFFCVRLKAGMSEEFRSLCAEMSEANVEDVALMLQESRWRQLRFSLQAMIARRVRPPRKPSFNVFDKMRTKSVWKLTNQFKLDSRDQEERTQLIYLRYLWKTEKKRLNGFRGVWEQPQTSMWKIANFTSVEGLRNRLVRKKHLAEPKHAKSVVQPPLTCVTSGGETSIVSDDLTECSSDIVEAEDWVELSFPCERIWHGGSVSGLLDLTPDLICFSSSKEVHSKPEVTALVRLI